MPYRIEFNGRYEVYDGEGNLVAKYDDWGYISEILGNNQGSGYTWKDTKKEK